MNRQTQQQTLGTMLEEYRAGTRGLPTYAELAAVVGSDHDGHAAINAAQRPSLFDEITGTAGKSSGPVHVRAGGMPMVFDDVPITAEAIETAARLCDEQAVEWDSDAVVNNKNYPAHCAALIRAMGQRGCP
ncbi:hypothetical protein AB4156_16200 [Cupriavidus sp. 2MCAB6]|uniref:hypothetical protein n=1 Tax=Cupriavidus sp. 2MCAB6 TaxID=3232981 RepID=UPI003F93A6B9